MDKKAEVLLERLLEYFEEIMSVDLSLQIWFDSGVDSHILQITDACDNNSKTYHHPRKT